MRTICDVCESAAAVLFCAADEAALCRPCDDKVHKCNKLASRHVRVGLADPSEVPRCDICENAPAFFYCEIDGSSLCLQCDMIVHVGGKRTHGRYLLLRQRVEFLTDKAGHLEPLAARERLQNGKVANGPLDANGDDHGKLNTKMIDLNTRPHQSPGQASNTQGKYSMGGGNRERDMEN